jgi:hypothetical protein
MSMDWDKLQDWAYDRYSFDARALQWVNERAYFRSLANPKVSALDNFVQSFLQWRTYHWIELAAFLNSKENPSNSELDNWKLAERQYNNWVYANRLSWGNASYAGYAGGGN